MKPLHQDKIYTNTLLPYFISFIVVTSTTHSVEQHNPFLIFRRVQAVLPILRFDPDSVLCTDPNLVNVATARLASRLVYKYPRSPAEAVSCDQSIHRFALRWLLRNFRVQQMALHVHFQ